MKLTFLGTKGEIEESATTHQFHSSMLVSVDGYRLLIDYGKLRRYTLSEIRPGALLITHAHPDHYAWINEDVETEVHVWTTMETLEFGKYKPLKAKVFQPGRLHRLGPLGWLGYRVIHSLRCPAVGFKITARGKTLVYNPDLVAITDPVKVLKGVDYYIGDGSAIRANLVRRRGDQLFGHTRITTQVKWCRDAGIKNIIFTHLGKETISKETEFIREHPELVLAYDGMDLEI
jgi:ribonuclease BN (tRNA processing enzyme)